jgi:hypothetical protein
MTKDQRATLEMLSSMMDNIEHEQDYCSDDLIVSGDDIDGARVCYITPTGHTSWLN